MVDISPIAQDSLRHSKDKQTAAAATHLCLRPLYPRIPQPQINPKLLVTPIHTRKACAASPRHIILLLVLSKPDCQLMALCHFQAEVIKTLYSSLNKRPTKKKEKKKSLLSYVLIQRGLGRLVVVPVCVMYGPQLEDIVLSRIAQISHHQTFDGERRRAYAWSATSRASAPTVRIAPLLSSLPFFKGQVGLQALGNPSCTHPKDSSGLACIHSV